MDRYLPRLIWIAAFVVVAAVLLAAISGFGHRWGWWHFRTGFSLLRWSVYMAIGSGVAAIILLLLAGIRRRLRDVAAAGIVLLVAMPVILIPVQWLAMARTVPPIHDITTDTANPPTFDAILPLRGDDANPVEYAGEEIASQQREAYPFIKPMLVRLPREEVFATVLAAAESMGWEIVAADAGRGQIEAVATTFWFGFKDDVVIRITQADESTRIDMRSISRVGRSDVGANAMRIHEFFDQLEAGWR